jgi:ankyrin repeat protein
MNMPCLTSAVVERVSGQSFGVNAAIMKEILLHRHIDAEKIQELNELEEMVAKDAIEWLNKSVSDNDNLTSTDQGVCGLPEFDEKLWLASELGNVEELKHILAETRLNIDQPNTKMCTPIYIASRNGHCEALQVLFDHGSTAIDKTNKNGRTPIWIASQEGHASVVELLLDRGSKAIDEPASDGTTPLCIASEYGHVSVVKLLLDNGSKAIDQVNDDGDTPVSVASAGGHTDIMKLLQK